LFGLAQGAGEDPVAEVAAAAAIRAVYRAHTISRSGPAQDPRALVSVLCGAAASEVHELARRQSAFEAMACRLAIALFDGEAAHIAAVAMSVWASGTAGLERCHRANARLLGMSPIPDPALVTVSVETAGIIVLAPPLPEGVDTTTSEQLLSRLAASAQGREHAALEIHFTP
jgi:hypothetical protein